MTALMPVLAHVGHNDPSASGFAAGFVHPWLGLDHLLAMIAVGLLAVMIRDKRAVWLVPVTFVGCLIAGGLVAWLGAPLPGVEYFIAASVVVLGVAIAAWKNVTLAPAMGLVGLAAVFHGYAHVAEMHGHILAYGAGMTIATAMLHALGVGLGLAMLKSKSTVPVRIAGGAIAAVFAITLLPM